MFLLLCASFLQLDVAKTDKAIIDDANNLAIINLSQWPVINTETKSQFLIIDEVIGKRSHHTERFRKGLVNLSVLSHFQSQFETMKNLFVYSECDLSIDTLIFFKRFVEGSTRTGRSEKRSVYLVHGVLRGQSSREYW